MRTADPIAALLISAVLCCAASGAPRVVVTSTQAGDLTIIDASRSTGSLVWQIKGQHWLIDGGRIAVCRGDFIAAVAAGADGQADLVLLPDGADIPDDPPADDLTARVRELAKRLPAGERAKVAKIHADLAAKAGKEITSADALFRERSTLVNDALGDAAKDWAGFFSAVNGLLDAVEDQVSGEAVAADFAESFRQIAEGLK